MDDLTVTDIAFQGSVYQHRMFFEHLRPFSHKFLFGKSYEHEFIESYFDLYLKEMIDFLRDSGARILIPAILTPLGDKLCDEVVLLNKGLS